MHLVTIENSIQLPTTTNIRYKSGYLRKTIEDPPSKFLTTEKNSDVCSGAAGYIS
jgi:hypothetical protein